MESVVKPLERGVDKYDLQIEVLEERLVLGLSIACSTSTSCDCTSSSTSVVPV